MSSKIERLGEVFVVTRGPDPEPEIEISLDDAEAREEVTPPPIPLIVPAWSVSSTDFTFSLEDPLYIREDLWKVW